MKEAKKGKKEDAHKRSPELPATERAITGVPGLDYLLRGGLPCHRIHLIEGHPGAGKTTLGLQFLLEGVRRGESCMYITLSESADELRANAASHGWDLSGIHMQELQPAENLRPDEQYTLFHPSEIELGDLSRSVFEAVEKFKPARTVLDSVSDMRLLARDSLRYRRQILGLKQFFAGRGCTLLLLNEIGVSDTDAHIQSLAHGVIRLEQSVHDFGIARRRLEIAKMRGVAYVGGFHDFKIETGGLRIFPRLQNRRQERALPTDTLKTGLAALDSLLENGVPMGTCTLVLGPSGVGKSTLASHYLASAAKKGIHCAAFLFDEQRQTFLDRADALGMNLSKYAKSDLIKISKVEPGSMSPGEFSHHVRRAVENDKVRVVLIDSLTGYLKAIPESDAAVVRLHELVSYLASCGAATFLTVAQQGMLGQNMMSPIDVSYIADTMFMMRFFEAGGSVRKALSVVKKRTGMHETTIREIGIKNNALWVGDPLTGFRGVLTGVPEYTGPIHDDKRRVGKKA
jgi:circadian clock protein KaiC